MEKKPLTKVRIDKWLYAVRVFKTRSLSTDACHSGKVKMNDKRIKPGKYLTGGETITVQKGLIKMIGLVKVLIDKRVSAKIVTEYMEDLTPESSYQLQKAAFQFPIAGRNRGKGRPTKKERREIDKLKWE